MSVEQRLRAGLTDNTQHLSPNLDHELAIVRRRVHRRRLQRRAGFGLAAVGAIAAGIAWLPGAVDAIGGLDGRTAPAVEQTVPTPTATPLQPPQGLAPGTYAFEFIGSGADAKPRAVIEISSAAFRYDGALLNAGPSRAIGLWTVADVSVDPCYGTSREWVDPGVTVAELAAALAAQPLKNGTEPVPVELGGYQGLYLETLVPPTGFDIADCVDASFISWRGDDGSLRRHAAAGEVDRLWILDAAGDRLVIDASHTPGTSTDEIAELTTMVESITFTHSDQPEQ